MNEPMNPHPDDVKSLRQSNEALRKRVMGLETQIDYDNECIERIRGHGMILELKLARFKAVLLELEQFISKVGHPKSCGQSMDYMGLTPDDTPACSCDKDKTLAAIRKLTAASEVIERCERGLIEWTIYKSEHVEQALAAIKEWKEKQ